MFKKLIITLTLVSSAAAMDLNNILNEKSELVRQTKIQISLNQNQKEFEFINTTLPPLESHWTTCALLTPQDILSDKKNKLDEFYFGQLINRNNIHYRGGLRGSYIGKLETLSRQLVTPQLQQQWNIQQQQNRHRHVPIAQPNETILAQLQVEFPFTPNYVFIDGEIRHKDWAAPVILSVAPQEDVLPSIETLKVSDNITLNVFVNVQSPVPEPTAIVVEEQKDIVENTVDQLTTAHEIIDQLTTVQEKKKKKKKFHLINSIRDTIRDNI